MTEQTHSPLPYTRDDDVIETVDESVVISCRPDIDNTRGYMNWDNNSEFVVRACNNHYKLIEALEAMMDKYGGVYDKWQEADIKALSAIKSAKGE